MELQYLPAVACRCCGCVCEPEPSAEILALSHRQRTICLLLSLGKTDKQIASALDVGLRTIENEKKKVAEGLSLFTAQLVIWAVENRAALSKSIRDSDPVSGDGTNITGIADLLPRQSAANYLIESACEYSI